MTREEAVIHVGTLRTVIKDIPKYSGKAIDEALDMAIKALEQRWVPVSERPPKDRESVLLSTNANEVFEGSYFDDDSDRQWYSCRDETFIYNNVVTAWMPLPEPYEA